ncbi:hypothetical protein L873DRAFT_111734 [Choiromyces venosus 120613-1]|uniref:Transmembrane protein n=1 Tax=Choiromyces venosus 120613-1 TaxID=1336337 RepID=A0A3N4J402_9PEZI|nr:hypothetical protein L873DRAFT_111734 [Choiromyces venosus 120613-1]
MAHPRKKKKIIIFKGAYSTVHSLPPMTFHIFFPPPLLISFPKKEREEERGKEEIKAGDDLIWHMYLLFFVFLFFYRGHLSNRRLTRSIFLFPEILRSISLRF